MLEALEAQFDEIRKEMGTIEDENDLDLDGKKKRGADKEHEPSEGTKSKWNILEAFDVELKNK